jgi:hypothetical protein
VIVTQVLETCIRPAEDAILLMLKKLYLVFGMGVLVLYAASAWFGWELANSGSRSRLGVPFIYTGFRGGK